VFQVLRKSGNSSWLKLVIVSFLLKVWFILVKLGCISRFGLDEASTKNANEKQDCFALTHRIKIKRHYHSIKTDIN